MAATIREIMEAIEDRLKTIEGLRTSAHSPDAVNLPLAIVGVPPIPVYHQTMDMGSFLLEPTITVLTSAAVDRVGQLLLADLANPDGAWSIRAAVEGDPTLSGVVEDCMVISFQPSGQDQTGGYVGGLFRLRVVARGND